MDTTATNEWRKEIMQSKADAKALLAKLHEGLGDIVRTRQEIRDNGLEPLDEVKQGIIRTRKMLLTAGLSPQQIDATPGLEVDWETA